LKDLACSNRLQENNNEDVMKPSEKILAEQNNPISSQHLCMSKNLL